MEVKNKIIEEIRKIYDPELPVNIYELGLIYDIKVEGRKAEVKAIPTVCGSLREAMESLDKDREFLTEGNVFTDDQIDAYIALKFEEIHKFEHAPHPVEFEMYYSS